MDGRGTCVRISGNPVTLLCEGTRLIAEVQGVLEALPELDDSCEAKLCW